MTNNTCADCEVDEAVHQEIRAALSQGALSEGASQRLVRDVLGSSKSARRGSSSPRRCLAAGILATSVLCGIWMLRESENRETEPDVPVGPSVEEERKANEAFLKRAEIQAKISAVAKDHFIAVVGGDTLDLDKDLGEMLRRIDAKYPNAVHRFVFRSKTQGDVKYSARFGKAPFLSGELLNRMRIGLTGTSDGKHAFFRLAPGQKLSLEMSVPEKHQMVTAKREIPLRIGPPGTGVAVCVDAAYMPAYDAPVVLGAGFALPRFEIPGMARLAMPSGTHVCRRYLADVSVPELDIRFEPVEVISLHHTNGRAAGREDRSLRIAGLRLQKYSGDAFRRASREGARVLVVELPSWCAQELLRSDVPDPLRDKDLLSQFRIFWKPRRTAPATGGDRPEVVTMFLSRFDEKGAQVWRLPVSAETPPKHLRALLGR